MSEEKQNTEAEKTEDTAPEAKSGFFTRIFTKLDQSMKEKAEAKAQDNCCSGSDGKGGKCC